MKFLYVCSPYRGDIARNVRLARGLCREVALLGHLPFAPHLVFPQFLDDNTRDERVRGIEFNAHLLEMKRLDERGSVIPLFDALWVYDARGVSAGMSHEIDLAAALEIPVVRMPGCWKWIANQGW